MIVERNTVARVGDGEIDSPGSRKKVIVECPICASAVQENDINFHLDNEHFN